ncbi:MAG: heparinase, partial [Desulfobacteraceae bacterium]|nr:heparinase [Desulfobacteraceae bacterium]
QIHTYFKSAQDPMADFAYATFENKFNVFKERVSFDQDIDWHVDPITKNQWPKKFWGDIDYRDKNLGGVKFVWEFNRLYGLFPLGFTYKLTGEKKYAQKIVRLIKSWVKKNPYPIGVNWASGIESGVRLANLVWALSCLEKYTFSDDDTAAINTFVYFNAVRLHRYPSKYSSANNHLLAEGFGLFVAGLFFPHFQEADTWLKQGKSILENECSRQILPDGGSFEYSTTYLSFVFDFFLLFKICCNSNGIEYNKTIDHQLEKSCEFVKRISDENGNIPNIGDQDSAVLVNFGLNNHENFQSILNTGSILFDRPDLIADTKTDLKTFLLTGKMVPEQTSLRRIESQSAIVLKDSGLAVIRDRVDNKEILFVGNATPLGMAPLYAHGHLDALSFYLSVDGEEIFIDPGTYLYHNSGIWREYFRSTAAHNTLRINRKDMSKQTGDFMFARPYAIIENTLDKTGGGIIWKAGHDAYKAKEPFADVNREVCWDTRKNEFIIKDTITNQARAMIELFFHFHPECKLASREDGFKITRGNVNIDLRPDTSLQSQILQGSHEPVAGWYSPGFNQIMESFTIRLYGQYNAQSSFTTRICIN